MNLLILVVDDESDVEDLFRQQFRRDLRAGRFVMEFAQSAPKALQRIAEADDVPARLALGFFYDFDIFSDAPMTACADVPFRNALPSRFSTSPGSTHSPFWFL